MTSFEDRERAFEAKYAHDEEFRFRVTARRDKLVARWAAEQLHLSEQRAAALTTAILAVPDGPGHDERLIAHLAQTFRDHDRPTTPESLAATLHRCGDQARTELIETA